MKTTSALSALALVLVAAPAAVAAPSSEARTIEAARAGGTAPVSVTLLTGDKVLVRDGKVVHVQPATGREHIPISTTEQDGHTHVLPLDATPLLASGKLDRRLFDVTTLLEFGYDDARGPLPLIIGGHGVVAARSADSWNALSTSSEKVWLDGIRKPMLDRSAAQIGAPAAHQAGYTGKGVKVAVLDTGVDADHPDLRGKEVLQRNFTADPDNADKVGHGTHVAATIASTNAKYKGIAPDAQIMDGKVCMTSSCAESSILDGMRWAAEQGADVVNLSLGGGDTPEIDPLEEAVNTLSARYGTLFVIAAGNSGGKETVGSPGSADAALTVGAVDRDEKIAPFSSRGPRVGDGAIKPDVTAPGVGIVAAKAGTTEHVAFSGTSMATPHVAGAAALLAQQHPDWPGSQLKAALVGSAKPNPELTPFDQGNGRINLAAAINHDVVAEPGNLHLGFQSWPHTDDKPVTKQLAYVNTAAEPVTLTLSLQTTAPSGLLALGTTTLTVPAGGKATVPVVADTRVAAAGGMFTGTVAASTGEYIMRTPVSITSESEAYDVTFTYLDAEGKPASNYSPTLAGLDVEKRLVPWEPDGTVTARLPKGTYVHYAYIKTGNRTDIVAQPDLKITGATSVTLDARQAKPIEVTFPAPTTGWPLGEVSWIRTLGNSTFAANIIFFGGFTGVGVTQLGADLPADQFGGAIGSQARFADEPNSYFRFAWDQEGRLPTGFVRAPQKEKLARVETTVGQQQPGKQYYKGMFPVYKRGIRSTSLFTIDAGVKPVEYVTTETPWQPLLHQIGAGLFAWDVSQQGPARSYRPGERAAERMNYAVFGPSLPKEYVNAGRHEGSLFASLSMLTDNNGGSGSSKLTSGKTMLYRDGTKVLETERAGYVFAHDMPARSADYRVETELTRPFEFSTQVRGAWTFRSARTTGDVYTPVPLTMVRFTPKLDDANSVQAGRLLRVPMVIEQAAGADNGRIRSLELETSFDDGKTWRRAGVVGTSALIYHPYADGYVSLRAKTKDSKGNTSELTIIRAYKVTR